MVTWSLEGCCIPDSRGARPMWLSQVLGSTSCGDLWQNVLQIWCSVSSSQAEPRLNPQAAGGVFVGVYMGAPDHRNLQECRQKRLGDRSCKSGDPGLEYLKLRLLGTIQKLIDPLHAGSAPIKRGAQSAPAPWFLLVSYHHLLSVLPPLLVPSSRSLSVCLSLAFGLRILLVQDVRPRR